MWLIPRLEAFQRDNPEIDIRIDASDTAVDLDVADVDMALRYAPPENMPREAIRLFGETLTPVASPWLIKSRPPIKSPADLEHYKGERGRRGNKLPRGFQRVDALLVETPV